MITLVNEEEVRKGDFRTKANKHKKLSLEERFIEKIYKNSEHGCHNWIGAIMKNGYGIINIDGKNALAHRVAWLLTYGEIPEGLFVLHKCDNTMCVNPKHLFLGTQDDNMKDAANKNRTFRSVGELCGASKLTWYKVEEIRNKYNHCNTTIRLLAKEYNISKSEIQLITSNKRWK